MQIEKSRTTLTGAVKALAAVLAVATMGQVHAAGTHPITGEALSDNQTFTYRLLDQFPTLDPQLNEETAGFHVIRDLFEGLLNQDAKGNLVPGVATHYAATDGNTTYTFTLRENARWSNGDPVTAHDFVHAWQRAVDPATASPYGWYLELTEMVNAKEILAGNLPPAELGVRAVDDHTLEVKLKHALALLPGDDDLRDALSRAPDDHRGARRGLDGTGQHGLERRLRAPGAGAERVPHAREEPDVLGRRQRDYREGHRPRHQRLEPGAHPVSGRRARSSRQPSARAVSLAEEGAARRGRQRPAAVLLLLRLQPHRERQPGPARRAGAQGAQLRDRPRRDRRSTAQGRPVAGVQLHPPQDRRLHDARDRLGRAFPGRAGRRGETADRTKPG